MAEEREISSAEVSSSDLLQVKNLCKYFPIRGGVFQGTKGYVKAVDGISFGIEKGQTMGLVGESGCGKTTVGRTLLRLQEATSGEVLYNGVNILDLSKSKMRALRPELQIVFQDPYSSLNPRVPVGEIIGEGVRQHKIVPKKEYRKHLLDTMEACGLQKHHIDRYPHEFSGGQRQRICIARALALKPQIVIADEPVSALDVSIQAQIINLLKELQRDRKLTYLFISHDLSVVEHISDKVGVMYLGSLVEMAPKAEIFKNPMHPYTIALFSAVPVPDPEVRMNRVILQGDIPSPANPPKGCKFHTRCPEVMDMCKTLVPEYKDYGDGHFVACHLCQIQRDLKDNK